MLLIIMYVYAWLTFLQVVLLQSWDTLRIYMQFMMPRVVPHALGQTSSCNLNTKVIPNEDYQIALISFGTLDVDECRLLLRIIERSSFANLRL